MLPVLGLFRLHWGQFTDLAARRRRIIAQQKAITLLAVDRTQDIDVIYLLDRQQAPAISLMTKLPSAFTSG